jgi:hypothetical protein
LADVAGIITDAGNENATVRALSMPIIHAT